MAGSKLRVLNKDQNFNRIITRMHDIAVSFNQLKMRIVNVERSLERTNQFMLENAGGGGGAGFGKTGLKLLGLAIKDKGLKVKFGVYSAIGGLAWSIHKEKKKQEKLEKFYNENLPGTLGLSKYEQKPGEAISRFDDKIYKSIENLSLKEIKRQWKILDPKAAKTDFTQYHGLKMGGIGPSGETKKEFDDLLFRVRLNEEQLKQMDGAMHDYYNLPVQKRLLTVQEVKSIFIRHLHRGNKVYLDDWENVSPFTKDVVERLIQIDEDSTKTYREINKLRIDKKYNDRELESAKKSLAKSKDKKIRFENVSKKYYGDDVFNKSSAHSNTLKKYIGSIEEKEKKVKNLDEKKDALEAQIEDKLTELRSNKPIKENILANYAKATENLSSVNEAILSEFAKPDEFLSPMKSIPRNFSDEVIEFEQIQPKRLPIVDVPSYIENPAGETNKLAQEGLHDTNTALFGNQLITDKAIPESLIDNQNKLKEILLNLKVDNYIPKDMENRVVPQTAGEFIGGMVVEKYPHINTPKFDMANIDQVKADLESLQQNYLILEDKSKEHGYATVDAFLMAILNQTIQTADPVMQNVMQIIRNYTGDSDAKKGPLSTLTASGRSFSTTFSSGIKRESKSILDAKSTVINQAVRPKSISDFKNKPNLPANLDIGATDKKKFGAMDNAAIPQGFSFRIGSINIGGNNSDDEQTGTDGFRDKFLNLVQDLNKELGGVNLENSQ